ncbi:nuclease-related domain-containing protein [Nocardioides sp. SYSU DS0663]|uniref:nuclease-related domain-containing protein n=1 Tax=Nocardioides sp. SYSU DS0663 TaxID=3416445 RepID=UPI003F4BDCAE
MRLRYAGTCRSCSTELDARAEAVYERATKTIRCLNCLPTTLVPGSAPPEPVDPGTAGASARREYERRQAKREERIRAKRPKLGGLVLALSDDPQSTTAWDAGALGEERLGHRLNELASDTLRLLHDRRIPGSRANIDHLAVTPTGVYVIDAKRYVGKRPALRVEGGILRPRVEKLIVGSRDQTKLVDGVLKQVELVRSVVGEDLPVVGVLCFIESDWPLIGGAFTTRGVDVLWPKKLYPRLSADGPHASSVADVHARLASALPTA